VSDAYSTVAEFVKRGHRALFVTGAGISADSGLPTYRGVGGLYEGGLTETGVPIEEALSGPMFRRNPDLTWRHILEIERACRGARPNRGHEVIAELEQHIEVIVVTQNVDGLHRAAGSSRVFEFHGTIHRLRCTACRWRLEAPDYEALNPLPRCPECQAIVRPDVVLFNEMLPTDVMDAWQREAALGFDVVFSVGTSSAFPYVAEPVVSAAREGVPTVEINPSPTALSALVDVHLPARAATALDAVMNEM